MIHLIGLMQEENRKKVIIMYYYVHMYTIALRITIRKYLLLIVNGNVYFNTTVLLSVDSNWIL